MAMIPGLILSIVLFLTLRDAPRGLSDGLKDAAAPVSTREALVVLWRRRTYRYATLGNALVSIADMGALTWKPAFLMRSYGMSSAEVGGWLSLCHGILSPIGIVCGGLLSDFLGRYHKRAMLWVACGAYGLSAIFSLGLFGTTNLTFALIMLGAFSLVNGMESGPFYAMQQAASGIRYRATGAAVGFMIYNLMGVAISPFVVGLISDHLQAVSSGQSLRLSLLAVQAPAISTKGACHAPLQADEVASEVRLGPRFASQPLCSGWHCQTTGAGYAG